MSNKKRAIERANLLLERRFLIEAETGNSQEDSDGNKWYVAASTQDKNKFKIYVQVSGENNGTDPLTIQKTNIGLWGKISPYQEYYGEYTNEKSANDALNYIVGQLKTPNTETQNKGTTGTAGTAGTTGTSGITSKMPLKPSEDTGEITQAQLISTIAQNLRSSGIGK